MRARDFFASVRAAADEAERTRNQIERMEAAEGVRAQGYTPGVSRSRADVNGTARVISRVDYESRMRRRLEEDYALIDRGCSVIYGSDQTGMGGVDALLGSATADTMWWRFCDGAGWSKVAREVGRSESWCRLAVETALDVCDQYGMDAMTQGLGIAEDRPESF